MGGFPERARVLIGASLSEPVLHVCGGMSKYYPYARGFGKFDKTLDIDPLADPDYVQDARDPFPQINGGNWAGILMDSGTSPGPVRILPGATRGAMTGAVRVKPSSPGPY